MRCEVAREALSARLDGEPQQVPTQQVDAHLESCRGCRSWLIGVAVQTRRLASVEAGQGPDLVERIMASVGVAAVPPYRRWLGGLVSDYRRCGLVVVGAIQVAVALAQIAGVDFGLVSHTHGHGAATGAHLLHESTAWFLALGVAMMVAGIWTAAALGVSAIAGAFAVVLASYVAVDAYHGQVTVARIVSHVPVLLGLVFALLVVRDRVGSSKRPAVDADVRDLILTAGTPRDRRRRHLWPINRNAA